MQNGEISVLKHLCVAPDFVELPPLPGAYIFMTGAFAFHTMERQIGFSKSSYAGAIWWAFITGAAIGYGDLFPATFGGRIAAIWTASLGILWCVRFSVEMPEYFTRLAVSVSC